MITLKDFLLRTFGTTNIIIIEKGKFHPLGVDVMKEDALYHGENYLFRNKELYNRLVHSYGVIDNYLVIELER